MSTSVVWGFPNPKAIVVDESGTGGGGGGGVNYQSYVASVYQVGLSNPQAEVLENSIDALATWSRTSAGFYKLSLPTLGSVNGAKLWVNCNGNYFSTSTSWIPIYNSSDSKFYYYAVYPVATGSGTQGSWPSDGVMLGVRDNTMSPVELSVAMNTPAPDAILSAINIEIRLYQ